jgi:surface carbohydrate biosynthesis protein
MNDIIFLIEHKDRELWTAQKIAEKLANKGYSSKILSVPFHVHKLLYLPKPKAIVLFFANHQRVWPFSLVRELYGDEIPIFSMNWEQMLSPINFEFKKPRDQAAKSLHHVAWSNEFAEYLFDCGVNRDKIHICGNPNAEKLNQTLQQYQNNIRTKQRIFFPENYVWAFFSSKAIQSRIEMGYPKEIADDFLEYVTKSRDLFAEFLFLIANNKNREIILRPHPSISEDDYINFFESKDIKLPDNVIITKELDSAYWIANSDIIGSSWSTVCIDAAMIGKPTFFFVPISWPSYWETKWMTSIANIKNANEFEIWQENQSFVPSSQQSHFSENLANILANMLPSLQIYEKKLFNIKRITWIEFLKRSARSALAYYGIHRKVLKKDYFELREYGE